MKRIITFAFAFLFTFCVQSAIAQSDIKVKELNYGKSDASVLSSEKNKKSPSGKHNITSYTATFQKADTIKAIIGAQFGVQYELVSKKNEEVNVELTWIFPEGMKDQKGKSLSKLTYTIPKLTNTVTYSNYTLEGENEVVKGEWIFIIKVDGKELYRRKFILN